MTFEKHSPNEDTERKGNESGGGKKESLRFGVGKMARELSQCAQTICAGGGIRSLTKKQPHPKNTFPTPTYLELFRLIVV